MEIDGTRADCEVAWHAGMQLGLRRLAPPRKGRPLRNQVIDALRPRKP